MTNRFQAGLAGIKGNSGRTPTVTAPAPAEPELPNVIPVAGTAPSRKGKVVISAYFDPAVRQQLAIMAIKQDRSQAALLADALNLLFERHGEAPIAKA
ncbi:ribbon-helix-helix domain-containing protein [Methylobacterium pseudosasicola]|uniref:Antitoxin-like ribbon-helix-helix domain-containing protein n=1 Tax=Methylobacterium pseudosasicola TaxID=582667 RepID=A0A1I4U5D4_9HYPH|nr:ribbon-helix-helix domain-containing protein [Methylobacterium pseudosasicola]SFM83883.1 hypothetical protein SAMN05192568_106310 [Methylobacterium pseudosasicola]